MVVRLDLALELLKEFKGRVDLRAVRHQEQIIEIEHELKELRSIYQESLETLRAISSSLRSWAYREQKNEDTEILEEIYNSRETSDFNEVKEKLIEERCKRSNLTPLHASCGELREVDHLLELYFDKERSIFSSTLREPLAQKIVMPIEYLAILENNFFSVLSILVMERGRFLPPAIDGLSNAPKLWQHWKEEEKKA